MKIGKIMAGVLVFVGVAIVFLFTLKSLLGRMNGEGMDPVSVSAVSEDLVTEEAADSLPVEEPVSENEVSVSMDEAMEASTEEATEVCVLKGLDPDEPYFETMGYEELPGNPENYVVEATKDLRAFWDNGKENYLELRNFIIKKTYSNTQDLMCDYFVDLAFKDGSSLEGIRCNDVSALKEGRRFRYGYVMDDSTQQNGQNVMYLYLVQE